MARIGILSEALAVKVVCINMRVIIVEDDIVSRMVLKNILVRDGGYEVVEARNGQEALDLIQKGPAPELCITDIIMPGMDGLHLLQALRGDPRFASMPVILCTCVSDRNTIASAARLDVRHYILKPYSALKVLATIKDAVSGQAKKGIEKYQNLIKRLGVTPEQLAQLFTLLSEQIEPASRAIQDALLTSNKREAACQINALKSAATNIEDDDMVEITLKIEADIEKGDLVSSTDWDKLKKQRERLSKISERIPLICQSSAGKP